MSDETPELKSFLFLMMAWEGRSIYTGFQNGTPTPFRRVDIYSTNEYPVGRKGYTLTQCWRTMKDTHTSGLLILDSDVAIDPNDFSHMYNAMRGDSSAIHIGASLIWPKSTGYSTPVWAHRKFGTEFKEWRTNRTDVDTASFCFTYLPARLLEACISSGMANWTFPSVDMQVFTTARRIGTSFKVVPNCNPKHMNY
jgi:hypothetical protein